jgi:N-acetylglucosamine-6-phosphate deacetylase
LIADGNHVHPAVVEMTYGLFGPQRIMLITDSMGTEFPRDGEYKNKRYGKVMVKEGGIYSAKGNLIGSTVGLLEMCANMERWCKTGMENTLRMTANNQARLLGIKRGNIKKGYFADFVLIDNEYKLKKVFINGKEATL